MNKGRRKTTEGIEILNQESMKMFRKKENY